MWSQFLLENVHFAINIFAALVFFAVFWLYFDAWIQRKNLVEGIKFLGFLLISLSFIFNAIFMETSILEAAILSPGIHLLLVGITRIPGYLLIIISLLAEPLQSHPKSKGLGERSGLAILSTGTLASINFTYPILAVAVGFLYLRRATLGLENHIKGIALGFFALSIYEFFSLPFLLQSTKNVQIYEIVASFKPLWIIEHLILLTTAVIIGFWVFRYLTKRLQSQLFMFFTTIIIVIFLLTTVTFTGLLVNNLQSQTLRQLETDVKVLNLAIESKAGESLSDAQVIASNPQVKAAIISKNRQILADSASSFLLTKKQSLLTIVSDSGQVLARGEDQEKIGDSLSDDPLMKRALLGESLSSVSSRAGVISPEVSVRSATPVKDGDKIIGAVMMGSLIDNAFVDGVKTATGLETTIYGNNQISATTLVSADGKTRLLGIKESNPNIDSQVLQNGASFTGALDILNTPFFVAVLPLKDIDNSPVGMLFVGKPQIGVLQTASRSIEYTFIIALVLMCLSVLPSFYLSKYLSSQLSR